MARKFKAKDDRAKLEKTWERKLSINGSAIKEEQQCQIDEVIGDFGSYQLLIFMFKILIGATSAFNNLGVTFFAPTNFVNFWCSDSGPANGTHLSQHLVGELIPGRAERELISKQNNSQQFGGQNLQIFTQFLFSDERTIRHNSEQFSYDTPKKLRTECTYKSSSAKCESFDYDTGIWLSTIIDEWDLVCDRAWMISMTQSLYMSGFIISYLMFGYISDRFGRKKSLLIGACIEVLGGFGCAFASSVSWFMVFRFLVGLGNAGRTSSSYLIMIEWCGPKCRMQVSTLGSLGWAAGYCLMPWITLHFLHFRHMQLFTCFYEIIFVVLLIWIPESPRWLLTHKHFNEAYDVLLSAANFNGLIVKRDKPQSEQRASEKGIKNGSSGNHLEAAENNSGRSNGRGRLEVAEEGRAGNVQLAHSQQLHSGNSFPTTKTSTQLQPYTIEEFNLRFKKLTNYIHAKEFTKDEDKLSIFDLFRWKNLRRYALILFFVWASNSFIYYGIALRVGEFGGGNLFIAFTIAGFTELPSMAFTILCMKWLPRGKTNLFIYTTTGLLCALQIPLKHYEYAWLEQSTMMLAKLFNSCAFTCLLYQTMELFPTSIRQTAYSGCSLAGRFGSILAPFIKELAQVTSDFVPPVLYTILSCMTAFLIRDLPETKGSDLPDTLLEAERFKGTDKQAGEGPAAAVEQSHQHQSSDGRRCSLASSIRQPANGERFGGAKGD